MPATRHNVQRLDLRFRAEPARVGRSTLPGGWLIWCLLGIAVGIGCWLLGRQSLTQDLAQQLTDADSAAEAMLAVEGLLKLDADASLEIVRGLQHADTRVARTAYRTLDGQLSRWQNLESTVATARMRNLAERLSQLPDSTPPSNLILASSLASRVFTICLEQDDPQLRPIIALCETVFERAGSAHSQTNLTITTLAEEAELNELAGQIKALTPPPPLAPPAMAATTSSPAAQQSQFTAPLAAASGSLSDAEPQAPVASVKLINDRTRPRAGEFPSAGSATASFADDGSNTFSLSDDSGDDESSPDANPLPGNPSLDMEASQSSLALRPVSHASPVIVQTPATLSSVPLVQMKFVSDAADLDGIQDLQIEELVRLLASVQPRVSQAAALALRTKGMNDEMLTLASQLATGSAAKRLQLVQQIASRGDIEPRPWLLWMAEDGEPEVRKLSVALLSSMVDAHVERSLRILLTRERDASVEKTIREALLVGPQNFNATNSLRPSYR